MKAVYLKLLAIIVLIIASCSKKENIYNNQSQKDSTSSVVIITEDDSRDEDPQKIADGFIKGAEKAGKKLGKDLILELDRDKAIKLAIESAKSGDLVLILGKGHEKTILRADGPHDFEDIKVAKKYIRQYHQ